MPRRKFPSDHRPWFRVLDDILDDETLAEVTDAQFATFIRVLAMLNRTGSRDGVLALSPRRILALTHRRYAGTARELLGSCEGAGLFALGSNDLTVRNWAKIQGFAPAELRPDSGGTPSLRGEERRGEENTTRTPPDPSPRSARDRVKKKPKPKAPKIACPPVASWARDAEEEIKAARGCSDRELVAAIKRVLAWHEDGASRAARVKRTMPRWVIYLRDQDWPYETSAGNGRARRDSNYSAPPGEFAPMSDEHREILQKGAERQKARNRGDHRVPDPTGSATPAQERH